MDGATFIHEHTEGRGLCKGARAGHAGVRNLKCIEKLATTNSIRTTNHIYPEHKFHRHFWMSRMLFLTVLKGVRDYDSCFRCKPNATGKLGFTSYKNVPHLFTCLDMELPMILLMRVANE
jgi:hypothetical protein